MDLGTLFPCCGLCPGPISHVELSIVVHGSLSGEKYVCKASIRLLYTNENPSVSWATWLTMAGGSNLLAEVLGVKCVSSHLSQVGWLVLELRTVHLEKHRESCVLKL